MSEDWLPVWMVEATHCQQNYFDVVCGHKWTEYKQSDYNILKRNIGFAIFGSPKEKPNGINGFTGYEERQLSCINDVFGAIMEQNDGKQVVYVSFIYVCVKTEDLNGTAPVISVHKHDSSSENDIIFIDPYAQAFENWQHYLSENSIPGSVLCYPTNGVYSAVNGDVDVEFKMLPASTGTKVLRFLGIGAAELFQGGATAVEYLPLELTLLTGKQRFFISTALYFTGRGIRTLVDTYLTPRQPVGLDDSESRNCWLGIAGFITVHASEGACVMASERVFASKTVTLAKLITIESAKDGLANIADRIVEEEIIPLNMFQLASAVLFFKNSVITADEAYPVMKAIRNTASQRSSGHVNSSINQISNSENSSTFSGASELIPRGVGRIISTIRKHVGPKAVETICQFACNKSWTFVTSLLQRCVDVGVYAREFVQRLWKSWGEETSDVITKICKTFGLEHWSDIAKVMFHCTNETATAVEENSLQPYSNFESGLITSDLTEYITMIYTNLGPATVGNVCYWVCNTVWTFGKRLLLNYVNEQGYGEVVQRVWDAWADESSDVITRICNAFGVGHCSDIPKIMRHFITEIRSLTNCETAEGVPEQSQVTAESNADEENSLDLDEACVALPSDEIFNNLAKFVDFERYETAADFCGEMKFICKFVKDEFEKEKLSYEKIWKIVKKLNPNVNVKDFDQEYGISGNRNSHFLQQVFSKFKDEEIKGFIWFKLAYDSQKASMSTQEESAHGFFDGVTFSTFKNKQLAHNGMLSEKQYHDIARELTNKHAGKENVAIFQRGNNAVIVVNFSEFVITVQSHIQHGRVSGIAAMLHSPHSSENQVALLNP